MGLIHLPRAYFQGFAYWNPSTMNNNDEQPVYDPSTARLNWPWIERNGLTCEEDWDAYATTSTLPLANTANNNIYDTEGNPPAEWNYYGTNGCGFVAAGEPTLESAQFAKPAGSLGVTGYQNNQGQLITSGDPWLGLPLQLNRGQQSAKLVDVDPSAPWSSQIFVDSVSLGDATTGGFRAATAGRAHSRFVNLQRNLNYKGDVLIAGVGSALFQIALPKETIEYFNPGAKPGSLEAQVQAALAPRDVMGLTVRFITYLTLYFQFADGPAKTTSEGFLRMVKLYQEYLDALRRYNAGQAATPPPIPANRAYSRTVGWFAPWVQGELRSAPCGRLLLAANAMTPVNPPLPPNPPPPAPPNFGPTNLGVALVEYQAAADGSGRVERLALDLGSTVPEYDASGEKIDYGPLTLGLTPLETGPASSTTILATIPFKDGYDRPAYELTAGVIDLPAKALARPITIGELSRARFTLGFGAVGAGAKPALLETPFTIHTDDRAVYLDEPGPAWTAHSSQRPINLQIRYLGGKPPKDAMVGVVHYTPDLPGFGASQWLTVSDLPAPQGTNQAPNVRLIAPDGTTSTSQVLLPIPHCDDKLPYASVAFQVAALRPGPAVINFFGITLGPPAVVWTPPASIGMLDTANALFANVRVLPFDNALAIAFENWLRTAPPIDVVSQRVFDEVFRTYALMYPVMRFLRDPLQFQAWRGRIHAITDPALFETARYMPVTRALSAGQRRIIELWDAYANGIDPPPKPAARVRRG